jgi:hypothetical protein
VIKEGRKEFKGLGKQRKLNLMVAMRVLELLMNLIMGVYIDEMVCGKSSAT